MFFKISVEKGWLKRSRSLSEKKPPRVTDPENNPLVFLIPIGNKNTITREIPLWFYTFCGRKEFQF